MTACRLRASFNDAANVEQLLEKMYINVIWILLFPKADFLIRFLVSRWMSCMDVMYVLPDSAGTL